MAHYCDSKKLEEVWYLWILANRTPDLDFFRDNRLLWTKPKDFVEGKPILDPNCHDYYHVLAFTDPIRFHSKSGKIGCKKLLEYINISCMCSDDNRHKLDTDLFGQHRLKAKLADEGFVLEIPERTLWDGLLQEIVIICNGILSRFCLPSDCDRQEVANEVILQIAQKLRLRKLTYMPGRAPVFNLITTTIYRCIFSILGTNTRRRNNMAKLIQNIQNKQTPNYRSISRYDVVR